MNRRALPILLAGLAGGIAIGAAIGLIWASSSHPGDVRAAVQVHEDGRIEVALEHADPDSPTGWSERQLPRARFVSANAEPNLWYRSSAVTMQFAEPAQPATAIFGPLEIPGTPTVSRPFNDRTLFCVVTHGVPIDFFWFQVYSAVLDAKYWNDLNLRPLMSLKAEDQAAAINRCVDDGAAAIATTLPDADALQPALERAAVAGVRVMTFNSGADRASDVGSAIHVGLDEAAAGRAAAQRFIAEGADGDILCIIHEETNVGLEQRCDSLERHYTSDSRGNVIRLRIHDAADAEAAIAAGAVASVSGAIALNANTAYHMSDAIHRSRPDIILGAVTAAYPDPFAMLYVGRLDFVLWPHALEQGYLTVTAMLFAHGTPFPPEAELFSGAAQISIEPSLITPEAVRAFWESDNITKQALPAWTLALQRAIARQQALAEADNQ